MKLLESRNIIFNFMKKFIIFTIIVIIIIGILVNKGYNTVNNLTNQLTSCINTLNQVEQDRNLILEQLKTTYLTITDLHNEITTYKIKINTLTNELDIAQTQIQHQLNMLNNYESQIFAYDGTITDKEIDLIAQTVYGEARGLNQYEQSLVVWCILNRVDDGAWGSTITRVVTMKDQFHGYSSSHPITTEIRNLVEDVVIRWQLEKQYGRDFGRTLPQNYVYFHSSKGHNEFYYFTNGSSRSYYKWLDKSNPYQ